MTLKIDNITSTPDFNIDEWVNNIEIETQTHEARPIAFRIKCTKASDHNGAFDSWNWRERLTLDCLQRSCRIYSTEIPIDSDLGTTLRKVQAAVGPHLRYILLEGHGNDKGIHFSDHYKYETQSNHRATFDSVLSRELDIISFGCSTAPLAEAISKDTGASAFGPTQPTGGHLIEFKGTIMPIYVNDEGIQVGKHYRNGKEEPFPHLGEIISHMEQRAVEQDWSAAVFVMHFHKIQGWQHAQKWTQIAMDLGDPDAILLQPETKARYLEPLARIGHPQATFELGAKYYSEKKFAEALSYLQTAAQRPGQRAQLLLAIMYEFGEGVEKDQEKAELYYEKGKKDSDFLTIKGLIRHRRDWKGGFSLLSRAGKWGNVEALEELSKIYLRGEGTERDLLKAAEVNATIIQSKKAEPSEIQRAKEQLARILQYPDTEEQAALLAQYAPLCSNTAEIAS